MKPFNINISNNNSNIENLYLKVEFRNRDLEQMRNVRDLQYTHGMLKEKLIKDFSQNQKSLNKIKKSSSSKKTNQVHFIKTKLSDLEYLVKRNQPQNQTQPVSSNNGNVGSHKKMNTKFSDSTDLYSNKNLIKVLSPIKTINNIKTVKVDTSESKKFDFQMNNNNQDFSLSNTILKPQTQKNNQTQFISTTSIKPVFSSTQPAAKNYLNLNSLMDKIQIQPSNNMEQINFDSKSILSKFSIKKEKEKEKEVVIKEVKEEKVIESTFKKLNLINHYNDVVHPSNDLNTEMIKLNKMKENIKSRIYFNK